MQENLDAALASVATPYTYGVAVLLFLLMVVVIFEGNLVSRRFGTIDYFTALSSGKRSRLYVTVLLLNIAFLIVTLAALMDHIEEKASSPDGDVNQAQYQAAYTAIWASYILQLMSYMDLWSRISPSNSLFRFKKHVEATTVDGMIPTVTLGELDVSWSWFMTAEDSLEVAEDGMLFYLLAETFGNVDNMEPTKDLLSRSFSRVYKPVPLTDDVKSAPIATQLHERYVARRFNQRFWKTGIKFSAAVESTRKLSTIKRGEGVLVTNPAFMCNDSDKATLVGENSQNYQNSESKSGSSDEESDNGYLAIKPDLEGNEKTERFFCGFDHAGDNDEAIKLENEAAVAAAAEATERELAAEAEAAEIARVAVEAAEREQAAAEAAEILRIRAEAAERERIAAEVAERERIAAEVAERERAVAEAKAKAAAKAAKAKKDADIKSLEEALEAEKAAVSQRWWWGQDDDKKAAVRAVQNASPGSFMFKPASRPDEVSSAFFLANYSGSLVRFAVKGVLPDGTGPCSFDGLNFAGLPELVEHLRDKPISVNLSGRSGKVILATNPAPGGKELAPKNKKPREVLMILMNDLFVAARGDISEDTALAKDKMFLTLDTHHLEAMMTTYGILESYNVKNDGKIDWRDWFAAVETADSERITSTEFCESFTCPPSQDFIDSAIRASQARSVAIKPGSAAEMLRQLFRTAVFKDDQKLDDDKEVSVSEVLWNLDTIKTEGLLQQTGNLDRFEVDEKGKIEWRSWFKKATPDTTGTICLRNFVDVCLNGVQGKVSSALDHDGSDPCGSLCQSDAIEKVEILGSGEDGLDLEYTSSSASSDTDEDM